MTQRTGMMAVVAMLAIGMATPVFGCEPVYRKVTCYETVICTVIQEVPYVKEVTRYDHCGKPYCVKVVCYREVEVDVAKRVPYVKWVKVCE